MESSYPKNKDEYELLQKELIFKDLKIRQHPKITMTLIPVLMLVSVHLPVLRRKTNKKQNDKYGKKLPKELLQLLASLR